MTNTPKQNTGKETHTTNPKPAGQVEKVDGNGEHAGTINTQHATKK